MGQDDPGRTLSSDTNKKIVETEPCQRLTSIDLDETYITSCTGCLYHPIILHSLSTVFRFSSIIIRSVTIHDQLFNVHADCCSGQMTVALNTG